MNSMELNDHSRLYILESLNTIFILVCKIKGNAGGPFNRGGRSEQRGVHGGWCEYKEIFTNALLLLPKSCVQAFCCRHLKDGCSLIHSAVRLFLEIISYFNNNWSVISTMLSSWYCYHCFVRSFVRSIHPLPQSIDDGSDYIYLFFLFFLFFFLENAFRELIHKTEKVKKHNK